MLIALKTNCIVELLPQESLERAAALDKYLAIHGRPIGPLHGLPISVKEHVGLKNRRLTGGFISWWERRGREDALILKILWRAGAIPFARTTEPQTLMHLETSSNLYGVTVNPYNRGLTSGGSSGGEGALLGLQGSCLGIGTDIGGSIRSPAANCGVFGFRPSSYRLPIGGLTAPMLWEEQIVPVIGPLSTSLEGIRLFMKTIIAGQPWLIEPSCLPIPWSDQDTQLGNPKRLKLGIMWDDGVVRPHPPVLRALEEVKERLKGYGDIQIVDWNPYRHDEAWEIIANLYLCDNGNEEREAVDSSGEPWRPLSEFIIKENPYVTHKSIEEVWHWTGKREEYRKAYTRQWNSTGTYLGDELYSTDTVDVILCPVGPGAAPLLDHAKYWSYTSQWNLLDYPAVVFPVTKVDPNIDKVDGGYKPRNEKDKFNYDLCKSHVVQLLVPFMDYAQTSRKSIAVLLFLCSL